MIKEACGKDFPVSVRTTGAEPDVETAIAIAVMINIYRNLKNNFVENLDSMKW